MNKILQSILKPFMKKNLSGSGSTSQSIIPLEPGSFMEYVFSDQQRISASQAMRFYRMNSSIATAVEKIAIACEQVKPVIQHPDGALDGNHEIIYKLKAPNFFETYKELIGQLVRHYLLTKNAYICLIGDIHREPLQIHALKPQNVEPYQSSLDGYPDMYLVSNTGPGRGMYKRIEQAMWARYIDTNTNLLELFHVMGFSSESINIKGDNPLESIALEIRQQIAGKKHNISVLNQGGRLSLVVTFSGEMQNEDDFQTTTQRIQESFSGPNNAGRIAVLSGDDMKVEEFGKDNKDMDFANLDEIAKNVIFLKFGVPLPLVSLDASTYNNVELATFDFFENTVLPVFSTIMDGLSKVIIPRYNLNYPDVRLTYDRASIPVLMRQMLSELDQRKKVNIETINELRDTIGREDIEGGELLYQPATLVPLGVAEGNELTDEEIKKLVSDFDQDQSEDEDA